jgi:hypothetical protein
MRDAWACFKGAPDNCCTGCAGVRRAGQGREVGSMTRIAYSAAQSFEEPTTALPVVGFPELLTLDIPERSRMLPFLPEGGLVMVHAPRGIGKTWFVIGIGAA